MTSLSGFTPSVHTNRLIFTQKLFNNKNLKKDLVRHFDASSLCLNLWGNFLKFENYSYHIPYANPLPYSLLLYS
jgi:hypothetical protein